VCDANSGNAIVTPTWRGAVLQVAWPRLRGYPDGICSRIEVWLQNMGSFSAVPSHCARLPLFKKYEPLS